MEPGLSACERTKSRVFSTTYIRLGLLPFIQNLRSATHRALRSSHARAQESRTDRVYLQDSKRVCAGTDASNVAGCSTGPSKVIRSWCRYTQKKLHNAANVKVHMSPALAKEHSRRSIGRLIGRGADIRQ